MVMETRSKGTQDYGRETDRNKTLPTGKLVQRIAEIRMEDRDRPTGFNGVKVKQELIEESLNSKKTENSFTANTNNGDYKDEVEILASIKANSGSWRSTVPSRKNKTPGPRTGSKVVVSPGKRTRFGVEKVPRKNKKYFQDIREYTKTIQPVHLNDRTFTESTESNGRKNNDAGSTEQQNESNETSIHKYGDQSRSTSSQERESESEEGHSTAPTDTTSSQLSDESDEELFSGDYDFLRSDQINEGNQNASTNNSKEPVLNPNVQLDSDSTDDNSTDKSSHSSMSDSSTDSINTVGSNSDVESMLMDSLYEEPTESAQSQSQQSEQSMDCSSSKNKSTEESSLVAETDNSTEPVDQSAAVPKVRLDQNDKLPVHTNQFHTEQKENNTKLTTDRVGKRIPVPEDGVKSTAKVQFDMNTKENISSSLRRHKKNERKFTPTQEYINNGNKTTKLEYNNQFEVIAKAGNTTDEYLKQRGSKMVEEKTSANCAEFIWDTFDSIPEDDSFNDHFQVKDFLFRKLRKVVVHMKLITSYHINQLKYREQVKAHLFQNNIWLKPDRFETRVESSPGVILMISPKIANRDDFKEELTIALTTAIHNLKTDSCHQNNIVDNQESSINTQISNGKVPPFYLEISTKKWRDVRAEVLRINCAKDDSDYMKFLLSSIGEQCLLKRGVFLPEGLHLMEGKELVYTMLSEHNQYMETVVAIPISGLRIEDLDTQLPGEQYSIRESITSIEGVHSIEKSRDRSSHGKLFIVTTKNQEQIVLKALTKNIEQFYTSQTGQSRLIMAGKKRIPNPSAKENSVRTYAEILATRYHPVPRREDSPSQPNTPTQTFTGQQIKETKETKSRSSTQLPAQTVEAELNKTDTSELLKKMKEMTDRQNNFEQTQKKLQDIHRSFQDLQQQNNTRAESNIDEDKVTQLIENKFTKFTEQNQRQLQETETILRDEIKYNLDEKIQKISVRVGQQVASQIMEVFKQYMSPIQQLESTLPNQPRDPPRITQDSTPPITPQSVPFFGRSFLNNSESRKDDTCQMLKALNEIEPTTPKPCSPHDAILEQKQSLE